MPFATTKHQLEWPDGKTEIKAVFVSAGTSPKGSTWAMNPLPYSNSGAAPEFAPPCNEVRCVLRAVYSCSPAAADVLVCLYA